MSETISLRRPLAALLLVAMFPGLICEGSEERGFSAQDTEWPEYRGGPGHAGVSPDSSIKPPLKLLWSYRLDSDSSGDAGSGLTVAANRVLVNSVMSQSVVALDAHTGAFCWEFSHQDFHYKNTTSIAMAVLSSGPATGVAPLSSHSPSRRERNSGRGNSAAAKTSSPSGTGLRLRATV